MQVPEFLRLLPGFPDATELTAGQVQVGDTVHGSDHLEIGTVKDVVAADDETEAFVVVPRGLIFSTDTYIPLDAVGRRAGDQVFVNVPKLVIAEMPWDKPPARSERKEKYGLPAAQVKKLYGSRSPRAHDRRSAT